MHGPLHEEERHQGPGQEGSLERLHQWFARHSSDAVDGYIEEAMEEAPLNDRRVVQELDVLDIQDQLALLRQSAQNEAQLREGMKLKVIKMANNVKSLCKESESTMRAEFEVLLRPPAVANRVTSKIHSTRPGSFAGPISEWTTACGWN